MTTTTLPGGTFAMTDDVTVTRLGYGAMQLAGPHVFGPPADPEDFYNIANRQDDELIDTLADQGIAYVPYFPLGGFSPLQSGTLGAVAARLESTPMAVALAWLLQRSPNILLIPGTSSVAHLHENVTGAALRIPEDELVQLNELPA